MNDGLIPQKKISALVSSLKKKKMRVVFTNGVFDILHRGHVEFLRICKQFGDILIVGLNTDQSVKKIKGKYRPIQTQSDRAAILLALKYVDYAVYFSEERPDKLIEKVMPDVLVKGADYKTDEIAGAEFVKSIGGVVKRVSLVKGRSSTGIIKKAKLTKN